MCLYGSYAQHIIFLLCIKTTESFYSDRKIMCVFYRTLGKKNKNKTKNQTMMKTRQKICHLNNYFLKTQEMTSVSKLVPMQPMFFLKPIYTLVCIKISVLKLFHQLFQLHIVWIFTWVMNYTYQHERTMFNSVTEIVSEVMQGPKNVCCSEDLFPYTCCTNLYGWSLESGIYFSMVNNVNVKTLAHQSLPMSVDICSE